jgi:hypothetical protein
MADVIGIRVNGNFVYVDRAAHRKRIVAAIGPDIIKYDDDFIDGPAADADFDNRWTVTRVEAGAGESTMTRVDGAGGILRLTTDAAEDDGVNAQLIGESFKLVAGNTLYFGIRAKMSEATQSDCFFGLAITDTDILGGVTDRIGFQKIDGETAVKAMLEKNSTETLSSSLLTLDTSYHIYEFYVNSAGAVEVFIDGLSVWTPATTNLPNDEELRVTLQLLAGSAAARTCDIDWVRCYQVGGRAT